MVRLAKNEARPLSKLSKTVLKVKEVFVGSLIILNALEACLIYGIYGRLVWDIQLLAPIIGMCGYLLVFPLQRLNHTRTRRASTILLFFWLQQTLAHLLWLQTELAPPSPPVSSHIADFVVLCIKIALLVGVFGLECAGVEIGKLSPDQNQEYLKQRRQQLFEQRRQKLNGKANGGLPEHNGHLNGGAAAAPEESGFSIFSDDAGADGGYDATNMEKECPVNTANIFSRLTFHWMQPMMSLGSKKFLGEEDMWSLPPDEDAEALGKKFSKHWKNTRTKDGKAMFWTVLAKSYGGPFLFAAFLKAAQDMLAFAQPQVLRKLLQFVQNWDKDTHSASVEGYVLSASLFFVAIIQTSFLHQYFQLAFVTGMRVRAGLVGAIYKKSLRLSNEERGKRATGDIVNLMSVDATRLQDLCTYGHIIWSALFQMTLAFVSLYNLVGWQVSILSLNCRQRAHLLTRLRSPGIRRCGDYGGQRSLEHCHCTLHEEAQRKANEGQGPTYTPDERDSPEHQDDQALRMGGCFCQEAPPGQER